VNNVGVISEHPLYLSELRESDIWQTVNVNIGATTMMTRIVLPTMLRRRCGAIVNISSMAGVRPVPLLSVYSGSKVIINTFPLGHSNFASESKILDGQ